MKLFASLLHYLKEGSSMFAIVDSAGQVDIEAMAWDVVPKEVKEKAMQRGADFSRLAKADDHDQAILGWNVHFKLIQIVDPPGRWCVISTDSDDPKYVRDFARENTRPIFPPIRTTG